VGFQQLRVCKVVVMCVMGISGTGGSVGMLCGLGVFDVFMVVGAQVCWMYGCY